VLYYSLAVTDVLFTFVGDLDGIANLCPALRNVNAISITTCLLTLLTNLPNHVILDRGRLVGLWEYDTATGSIAWMSVVKKDKSLQDAVARTEQYVREQLVDARSFSLDSPKSRTPRIEALRHDEKWGSTWSEKTKT
jgi:hypothetical protein